LESILINNRAVDQHYEKKAEQAKVEANAEPRGSADRSDYSIEEEIEGIQDDATSITSNEKKPPKRVKLGDARFTRLRQVVSHPFCIESMLRKSMTLSEARTLREKLSACEGKATLIQQLRDLMKNSSDLEKFSVGLDQLRSRCDASLGGSFSMNTLLNLVLDDVEVSTSTCPNCKLSPRNGPTRSLPVS
jgi:hypothetical protein